MSGNAELPHNDPSERERLEAELAAIADGTADASNEPLTEETLQAKLQAYHKAYEEEFKQATEAAEKISDSKKVEELTTDYFRGHAPEAAAHIVWLAFNSTSDAVRSTNCRYIIERAFKEERESGDPIKDMLERLSKPTKKSTQQIVPPSNEG